MFDEKAVINFIKADRKAGKTIPEIADGLVAAGLKTPSGKDFSKANVSNFIGSRGLDLVRKPATKPIVKIKARGPYNKSSKLPQMLTLPLAPLPSQKAVVILTDIASLPGVVGALWK